MEANKVLDSPIIQNEGLTAYIPRYMVIKKGVIKDVPEDMELGNLTQQLNSDNQNKHPTTFQVIDAVRFKLRVKETNEETKEERSVWKESRAVCLTFRIKELPPHVYYCNMKVEVSTFVAAVRQCYKCVKFGHVNNFVRRKNNASHAEKQNTKGLVLKKCLNFNGDHRANSEQCPVIKKQRN
jgi:hypothetical protein